MTSFGRKFLRRLGACCCCCCPEAKVSPDDPPSRGVPPLPALPAPRVRQLIKATPEWQQQPPGEQEDPLSLGAAAAPPGPGATSVLDRVAALEAAAPRATVSMFRAAAESLARFYAALDQANSSGSSSSSSSGSSSSPAPAPAPASSSSSSSAAALAAIADVLAVVEDQEKLGGKASSFKKLHAKKPLSPPLKAKAEKKKPKRVRKAERRAAAGL